MAMDGSQIDWMPYHVEGAERTGRWLVTCDHASNRVPPNVIEGGTLGLGHDDMHRHIAFDVGAAGVARHLARALGAPALFSDFSRLVIDPNRGTDDPTIVMKLYDGTIVPGNRHVDAEEIARRRALCYDPYHDAYAELAARPGVAVCAVHSFTPKFNGRRPRPWYVGVLWAGDDRIARPLIECLRAEGLNVGDNEPYAGHLSGDSIDRHALRHGRPNVLVEVRNDLIETEEGQREWGERLSHALEAAYDAAEL